MPRDERSFAAIVPHRDRPSILAQSLSKLVAAWGRQIREIIVVDDGSAGGPPRLPARIDQTPVRIISQSTSRGPAAARNRGARLTDAPNLLFLDDDSYPRSGSLDAVAAAMDRHPRLAAIGFRVTLGESHESGGAFNAVIACGCAVRADAYRQVGGFPEELAFYGEEYGLCYRLIEEGWLVRQWNSPTVQHDRVAAQRDPARMITQLVRNDRLLFEPHVGERPEIRQRLQDLFEWRRILAARLGVSEIANHASAELLPALGPSRPWPASLWKQLCGDDLLRGFVEKLEPKGRTWSLWPIGKDTWSFKRALEQAGHSVTETLDPDGRYGVEWYADLPVRRRPSAGSAGIVVASFSPGQCENGLAAAGRWGWDVVHAGFGFLSPDDPIDQVVRQTAAVP